MTPSPSVRRGQAGARWKTAWHILLLASAVQVLCGLISWAARTLQGWVGGPLLMAAGWATSVLSALTATITAVALLLTACRGCQLLWSWRPSGSSSRP